MKNRYSVSTSNNTSVCYHFLKSDFLLFFRRGIIPVYIVLTLLYLLLLWFLPSSFRARAASFLIFTDTSALGFFFVGAVVQWEKREKIYDGLFVTPFSPENFLLLRSAVLTLISMLVSLVLLMAAADSAVIRSGTLLLSCAAIFLGSLFFTAFGIAVAVSTDKVNSYFIKAIVLFIPFALPFISLVGLWWNNWFLLLPTGAMVQLFYSTFHFSCMYGDPSDIRLIPLSFISLILWNLAGLFLAAKLFPAYSAAGFGASS
jgi:fluoroquinolone transport system permease protein